MMTENRFVHNIARHRYELHVGEGMAVAEYKTDSAGVVSIVHTGVPKELEGRGIGAELISRVLGSLREEGKKVRPVCSFVKVYIQRHPEWESLVQD